MAAHVVGSYVLGLVTVALLLTGMYAAVRAFTRARFFASFDKRLVAIVETAFLAQNTVLQIVRIGTRYYALAGGSGRMNLLCELPAPEITAWLDSKANARNT